MPTNVHNKGKLQYQCRDCGVSTSKWSGQCPDCGAWNTLEEVAVFASPRRHKAALTGDAGGTVRALADADVNEEQRMATEIGELDRVLGGGLVAGSVVLIGGDPGIGKSTLLIQVLTAIAGGGVSTLYVSGEESQSQIALRARRLGLAPAGTQILTETSTERILEVALRERPTVMVIDSIQTLFSESYSAAPGSVTQVRESAAQLVQFAKQASIAVFLIGHVTKDGALAGPRVLEHMVDTVLYFEGDAGNSVRMLRAIKNRFGPVNELGVFAMTEKGLREVTNPSAIFLSREQREAPGSVIMVTREGTRPLLVEVQALVDGSALGNPRRVTVGLEQNRLAMLLAVLHRHAEVVTSDQDVFVNVVGGVKLRRRPLICPF